MRPYTSNMQLNRCNANGCETLRLVRSRFGLPVGTRSVGCLTKLLEPTFKQAQFEEQFLQWEDGEEDKGAAPEGAKIAPPQDQRSTLQARVGQVTNYNEIRAVVLDYCKAISAVSRSTSTVGTNHNGGPANGHWQDLEKRNELQRQRKEQRKLQKEAMVKANTGEKVTRGGELK